VWAGPPFPSDLWRRAVAARNPDSPYVLPQVGEGELFRFASQFADPHDHSALWGRVRIVFLQYASDPIVFFDPGAIWRRPVWMREPPAPDVSQDLSFMPVVTQFQLALDMALSKELPQGYGHNYVARDYIDAWVEVTRPEGWTAADTEQLKAWCGPQSGHGCHNEKTGLSLGR
ncbi:MAG: alpha/beta-hydrolase family protein, partial [Oricola sp.]|nr:alpha/beta-hydrolase family protein [Oricola sp.]